MTPEERDAAMDELEHIETTVAAIEADVDAHPCRCYRATCVDYCPRRQADRELEDLHAARRRVLARFPEIRLATPSE